MEDRSWGWGAVVNVASVSCDFLSYRRDIALLPCSSSLSEGGGINFVCRGLLSDRGVWPLSSPGILNLIEEIQSLSSGRPLVSLVLSLEKPHLTASAFAPCLPGLIHGGPWYTGNSHRESWAEYWARLLWGREEGGALEGLP